jgi:benzoyl-CoA reductase/2-hydroxyglutaryl-CoA dehydratase subunit BcrC/BadD/HgdB
MDWNAVIRNHLKDRQRRKKMLHTPLSYRLMESVLKLGRKSFPLDAVYRLGLFALQATRCSYIQQEPVVWTSAFFPVEIVWSLGLTPFSPEIAAAFTAGLGYGQEMLDIGEEMGYSRDLCSFHRCIAGIAQTDCLPRPDVLMASTHLCDGAPLLFENMAEHYGAPFWTLDVPYHSGAEAESYVAEQLKEMWYKLADLTGRKADTFQLAETISHSNAFRENMKAVAELRRHSPAPVSGNIMMGFIYLFFLGQGSREAEEVSACLRQEVAAKVEKNEGVQERFRILWLHLKPYYSGELMDFVENKLGAALVCEDMGYVYWPVLDPEQPFVSLARKVLSNFNYKPLDFRIKAVADLARKYQVDGVIHFSHHGCRQSTGGAVMLKSALQKIGLPVLLLEGDCLDGRADTAGGMLTRLQAFFEILDVRKEVRTVE